MRAAIRASAPGILAANYKDRHRRKRVAVPCRDHEAQLDVARRGLCLSSHGCQKTYAWVDEREYGLMINWLRRKYRQQTWAEISKLHYPFVHGRYRFSASYRSAKCKAKNVQLLRTSDLPIRYHTKFGSEATPYDPALSGVL